MHIITNACRASVFSLPLQTVLFRKWSGPCCLNLCFQRAALMTAEPHARQPAAAAAAAKRGLTLYGTSSFHFLLPFLSLHLTLFRSSFTCSSTIRCSLGWTHLGLIARDVCLSSKPRSFFGLWHRRSCPLLVLSFSPSTPTPPTSPCPPPPACLLSF